MTTIINDHKEFMDSAYEPPRISAKDVKNIVASRKQGRITTKELIDETLVCVRQLSKNPLDKVSTYLHAHGIFSAYNLHEFMAQIQQWREKGCLLLRSNIIETQCGAYGKATFFTIQPPKPSVAPLSPVSLAFGTMVSGYTYFTTDPQVAVIVWKALGSKE